MDPAVVVPLAFFAMCAVIAVGYPLARAFSRRMDRDAVAPHVPTELSQRLERMEQAIDSIAVEVERISEGQRFTTKLLSERVPEVGAGGRGVGGVGGVGGGGGGGGGGGTPSR